MVDRLELSLRFQHERLAELQLRKRIREDVDSGTQKQQREYLLRKQMESIRKELGDDNGSGRRYRAKIEDRHAETWRAGRARARTPRPHGRGREPRVVDDPQLPRLADRRAVGERSGRRSTR